MTIPERFEPLLCSLKRLRASMKMSNFEGKYSPGYRHPIGIGETKLTREKDLLLGILNGGCICLIEVTAYYIEIKFTVNKGTEFWEFDNCLLNRG